MNNKAFVTEFFLKTGKSHKFEVQAGGKEVYVGFTAKVSSESWTAKSGKVRFTIKNCRDVDYRVMIYTRNKGKGDE